MFIDENNHYYSVERNEEGQCAIGTYTKEIKKLTKIDYFEKNNIKISKICTSICSYNTYWITDKGKLYANGINHGQNLNEQNEPILVNGISKVIDVVSQGNRSVALTSYDIIIIINNYKHIYNQIIPNEIIKLIKKYFGYITV